nr:hypothetical protein [Tanacetum cinerariifolium]
INQIPKRHRWLQGLVSTKVKGGDTLIESSPKFDYFLEEFSGELAHIDLIPPRIEEADFDLEEEIQLLSDDPVSLPENKSSNFDHHDDPSFPRPSSEPPDVEDKVFKPGILSYLLVSHRDKNTFDFSENPMMLYGGDISLLDVPFLLSILFNQAQVWGIEIAPDLEASRARGLVHRPLEFQSFAYENPIS